MTSKMAVFVLLLLALFGLVKTSTLDAEITDDEKNYIKWVSLAKINRFRAKNGVNAIKWNPDLAFISEADALNCTLRYDVFDDNFGRVIFHLGREDGLFPDVVNGTFIGLDWMYDERLQYHPKSNDYDNLQAFKPSWEFTQMVWASSTEVGCGWSFWQCPYPDDGPQIAGHRFINTVQFVCTFYPAGNQWEQFANVHCKDGCFSIEPQTNTIDVKTVSWATQAKRTAGSSATSTPTSTPKYATYSEDDLAKLEAAVEKVDAFRDKTPEEFMPDYIPGVQNRGMLLAQKGYPALANLGYDAAYVKENLAMMSDK